MIAAWLVQILACALVQAPPAPSSPQLLERPSLAPVVIPGARHNHLRDVEEAKRGTEEGSTEEPADETTPDDASAVPSDGSPPSAPKSPGLQMAPSATAAAAPVPATVAAPAAVPAAAPFQVSAAAQLVLRLLGALAILVGPAIAAMWLLGHGPAPKAE
jgi:hypothetical protein